MDKILIFDFGSQTTQLIGRRIRESEFYSEIVPCDLKITEELLHDVKGIIFSGSPSSVYDRDAPEVDKRVYDAGIPILGICYGLQRIVKDFGGVVMPVGKKEYGRSRIFIKKAEDTDNKLFRGIDDGFSSWMSHGDALKDIPGQFKVTCVSEHNHTAAIACNKKNIFGIQFHPEVTHCEHGSDILNNFAGEICRAKRDWDVNRFYKQLYRDVKDKAGAHNVLVLISGGVDSSVLAALLLDAIDKEKVFLMYIDTGLMRKDETVEVTKQLKLLGAENLYIIDASGRFYTSLKGITNPEEKRRIIGDLFMRVQTEETTRLGIKDFILAQGTLYTDMIESGKGVGEKAHVIKSHHNVRSPLIEEQRREGRLLEPLSILYKDEVRALGEKLGLPDTVISRHPFPGPGLAVRIVGEVTEEKCSILREADFIFMEKLKKKELYGEIWQAFAVLLPIRSVGVAGDSRKYGYVLSLRAIISRDGMTGRYDSGCLSV